MAEDIIFEKNRGTAGSATKHDNTIFMLDVTVPANTLTAYGSIGGTTSDPQILKSIVVTPASATAGAVDKIQLVGATTKELIISGTWKFNQATTFEIPLNIYIDESVTLNLRTTAGSPSCGMSAHFGTV